MRAGFATSVVLHAALIAFGLVSLGSPKPLDAGAMESLPVDIVPLEELTQIQEGDKTASLSEMPAPKPTTKPESVPDAKTTGDNDTDLATPPTPEAKPQEVKTASAPPPPAPSAKPEPPPEPKPVEPTPPKPVVEEKPAPPEPKVEPKAEAKPEPAVEPEPTPEAEPLEQAKPEPKPEEKKPEPAETAEAKPEEMKLPDSAPSPLARPQEKPAETKVADAAPQKTTSDSEQKSDDKSLEDQVAMLLDKQKPSGGGAKRSQAQKASLGGKQTTGAKLSQGEMDALSGQLAGCWNIPAGMEGGEALRVSIRFNLDATGKLDGRPTIDASSGNPVFDQSAVRAVQKCDREGLTLPKDKADTWSEVVVNFDPSQMF